QAEDGIRDFHVTGVQTCALPIYQHYPISCFRVGSASYPGFFTCKQAVINSRSALHGHALHPPIHDAITFGKKAMATDINAVAVKIGRASCRERGEAKAVVRTTNK